MSCHLMSVTPLLFSCRETKQNLTRDRLYCCTAVLSVCVHARAHALRVLSRSRTTATATPRRSRWRWKYNPPKSAKGAQVYLRYSYLHVHVCSLYFAGPQECVVAVLFGGFCACFGHPGGITTTAVSCLYQICRCHVYGSSLSCLCCVFAHANVTRPRNQRSCAVAVCLL